MLITKTGMAKMAKENRGFTLVELIIVVAVILVLIAVIAPQYTQYVERSRRSNDLQVATAMLDALTVIVADPKNEIPSDLRFQVYWNTAGDGTIAANALYAAGGQIYHPNDDAIETALHTELAAILGLTYNGSDTNPAISGAVRKSEAAKQQSLVFYIYTETGRIVLQNDAPYEGTWHWNASGNWIDEIGLDIERP